MSEVRARFTGRQLIDSMLTQPAEPDPDANAWAPRGAVLTIMCPSCGEQRDVVCPSLSACVCGGHTYKLAVTHMTVERPSERGERSDKGSP